MIKDIVAKNEKRTRAGFSEGIYELGKKNENVVVPTEAWKILEGKGISVELINIHTIKPIDEEAIIKSIQKTKCAFTAEEHNILGRLDDSIAHVAAAHYPIPIQYVGTKDTFGESGKPEDLLKKYGLDTPDIVKAAEIVISKKNNWGYVELFIVELLDC